MATPARLCCNGKHQSSRMRAARRSLIAGITSGITSKKVSSGKLSREISEIVIARNKGTNANMFAHACGRARLLYLCRCSSGSSGCPRTQCRRRGCSKCRSAWWPSLLIHIVAIERQFFSHAHALRCGHFDAAAATTTAAAMTATDRNVGSLTAVL